MKHCKSNTFPIVAFCFVILGFLAFGCGIYPNSLNTQTGAVIYISKPYQLDGVQTIMIVWNTQQTISSGYESKIWETYSIEKIPSDFYGVRFVGKQIAMSYHFLQFDQLPLVEIVDFEFIENAEDYKK